MSFPRKMSYFELSPLLLKRVKLIPAVLHLFGSMSPLVYLRACYSWTCCKKSLRNWKKRIWLFDPRYIQPNSFNLKSVGFKHRSVEVNCDITGFAIDILIREWQPRHMYLFAFHCFLDPTEMLIIASWQMI